MNSTQTRHLNKILKSPNILDKTARNAKKQILSTGVDFDAIVCTGNSGVPLATLLSIRMRKQLTIVNPVGVTRHSAYDVEGLIESEHNYVIVDDLIDTGATISRLKEKMAQRSEKSQHVLTYLYGDGYYFREQLLTPDNSLFIKESLTIMVDGDILGQSTT